MPAATVSFGWGALGAGRLRMTKRGSHTVTTALSVGVVKKIRNWDRKLNFIHTLQCKTIPTVQTTHIHIYSS